VLVLSPKGRNSVAGAMPVSGTCGRGAEKGVVTVAGGDNATVGSIYMGVTLDRVCWLTR